MENNNQSEFYRTSKCLTRLQKIKLLEAVQNQTISLRTLTPFAGMEFFLSGDHFTCRENMQQYTFEDIEKVYNDLPTIKDAAQRIEFKAMVKGELIVNRIVIMPISESEILENLL